MDHTRAVAEAELDQLLEDLATLYATALVSIESINDPQAAFEVASAWQATIKALHDQEESSAARARARQAVRIRGAEALSLAGLADRIGVSKSRAEQLVNRVKAGGRAHEEAAP